MFLPGSDHGDGNRGSQIKDGTVDTTVHKACPENEVGIKNFPIFLKTPSPPAYSLSPWQRSVPGIDQIC